MDDFPAGPTSPEPRRLPLSVVIPVRNGGRDFERCLRGLRESSWTDFELVVVDDGSTDGSAALAESFGARVIRHERPLGPAAARNAGAEAALAPLVFFLDADVALHPDALERTIERFTAHPELGALFGSYDDRPAARGLVSQFRNLMHHYIHQRGPFVAGARPAHTFWTGCGAIRKELFHTVGGFDPARYRRPAIEDIELGYRITRAGGKIALVSDVLATHLKRWTLRDMIRTDIFQRGVPWMLLIRRERLCEIDLNVSPAQRASVAATGLGGLAFLASPWQPRLLLFSALAAGAILTLNVDFYRFLIRKRGWVFAAASLPLHVVYFCCCGLSVVIALGIWHASAARTMPIPGRTDPAATPPPAPHSNSHARRRRRGLWSQR